VTLNYYRARLIEFRLRVRFYLYGSAAFCLCWTGKRIWGRDAELGPLGYWLMFKVQTAASELNEFYVKIGWLILRDPNTTEADKVRVRAEMRRFGSPVREPEASP
jgi:hypothetical protein